MLFIIQLIRKFIFLQAITISLALIVPLTGSTNNLIRSESSGYWQEIECVHIPALNQGFYECSAMLNKPNLLKGQTGLCGIFAFYNSYCIMQALENPNNAHDYLAQMKSVDAFHKWVKENESVIAKIQNKHKRVGNLNGIPLQSLTAGMSQDQANRIKAFDYHFIEEEEKKPTSQKLTDITGKFFNCANLIKRYIQRLANSFTCKQFAKQFQSSSKPHVVVFNLEDHWITVVFTSTQTLIADSCNLNYTTDYRVFALDAFMRTQ